MRAIRHMLALPERRRVTGDGSILLLCDHASNIIPENLNALGLGKNSLDEHFAWDVGAAGVTRHLSDMMDCPALLTTASRLLIDCNRDPADWDSIVERGEETPVPGNIGLTEAERTERIAAYHAPYHDYIDAARIAHVPSIQAMVSIHSFVPIYHGRQRPWHIGLIHNRDHRLAESLARQLRADDGLVIGDNEPYAPSDRVYYTLWRHAEAHGLPSVMIEIRNDLIATGAGQLDWASRLAPMLLNALNDQVARKAA